MGRTHDLKVTRNSARIDVGLNFLEANADIIIPLITSENKEQFIAHNKTIQQLKRVADIYAKLP